MTNKNLTFILGLIMVLSCESDKQIIIDLDPYYFRGMINNKYYNYQIYDTTQSISQLVNRKGSCCHVTDTSTMMQTAFGILYSPIDLSIGYYDLGIYFAYNHDMSLLTDEPIFYGNYYFKSDSEFHNIFSTGIKEFLYSTPVNDDESGSIYFGQKYGVYISLNAFSTVWHSYKSYNGILYSNSPINRFEVLESKSINYSYDQSIYGNSRSRQIKGVFSCTLYNKDIDSGQYDSLEIVNAEFYGLVHE